MSDIAVAFLLIVALIGILVSVLGLFFERVRTAFNGFKDIRRARRWFWIWLAVSLVLTMISGIDPK